EAVLTSGDGAGVGKIYHHINGKFDYHQRVYAFFFFKNIIGRFLFYYLSSGFYRVAIMGSAKSTVDSLRLPLIQDFEVALPPLPEQRAIAAFLDEKTAQIDQALAQKARLIELLKERKQILIQQLVTGQRVWNEAEQAWTAPAATRDSGVDWIGEVPEEWEVKRAKYLFDEINERSQDGSEELLSVSHMTGVTPRSQKDVNMFMAEDYSGSKLCQPGDVVYNIMWTWMGALGVASQTGIVSPSYGVYRQKNPSTLNSTFLEHRLTTLEYITYYNMISTGLHSSRLRFYSHMFMNMAIAYPTRSEQEIIVAEINRQSTRIERAIALQEQQMEKLREYRAVLIDAAVRGRIRVPGVEESP
ncbi:MAG: restriction endonuclease subunit S, partial [Bacteroidota bacterium]